LESKFDIRILAVIIVLLGIGAFVILGQQPNPSPEVEDQNEPEIPEEPETEPEEPTAEPEEPVTEPEEPEPETPPELAVQFTEIGHIEDIGSPHDVYVSGDYAYIADSYNEIRIIEISDKANPEEINFFDPQGPRRGQGVYYSDPLLYIADGYGMLIVNVTNPVDPVEVGFHHTSGFALKIYLQGEFAYVADREGGLLIVNVSDPWNPWRVSRYFDAGSVHVLDVVVSGDYAYVAMGGLGLRIVDVSDPVDPYEVGFYDTEGTAESLQVSGSIVYLADGDAGLRVFDISDPTTPHEVGFYNASDGGYAQDVFLSGGYVYVGDGPSSLLQVFDAIDPSSPDLVGEYETMGYVRGIYISDEYAFIANGGNGMLILHQSIS
jgi:hypothetical protein